MWVLQLHMTWTQANPFSKYPRNAYSSQGIPQLQTSPEDYFFKGLIIINWGGSEVIGGLKNEESKGTVDSLDVRGFYGLLITALRQDVLIQKRC